MSYGNLVTSKSAADTKADLRETFRKWGVGRDSFEIFPPVDRWSPDATVEYWKNGTKQTVTCKRFEDYPTNLRGIYLALEALRLADQRGILPELAAAAVAMLPPAKTKRPSYEVLQIYPDADIEIAEAAFRALSKKLHPDVGGSHDAMKELNEAIQDFRRERENGKPSR